MVGQGSVSDEYPQAVGKISQISYFLTPTIDLKVNIEVNKDIVLTLDAGLLARSQYPEGPATGHLDTGFSWFPCVYKQMLR